VVETKQDGVSGYLFYNVMPGHGVGLSYAGAAEMANQGKTYIQILDYYYDAQGYNYTQVKTLSYSKPDYPTYLPYANSTFAARITADNTAVRSAASASSSVLATYQEDTRITVMGLRDGWFTIRYGSGTGYVQADRVEIDSAYMPEGAVLGYVSAASASIYTGPGSSYIRAGSLSKYDVAIIVTREGGWYKIKWDNYGGAAYVSVNSVVASGEPSTDTALYIGTATANVNVRTQPVSGSIVGVLSAGSAVPVYDADYQGTGWCQVLY
jgi:uncharacterized protein YgiM (DUF1202 family)